MKKLIILFGIISIIALILSVVSFVKVRHNENKLNMRYYYVKFVVEVDYIGENGKDTLDAKGKFWARDSIFEIVYTSENRFLRNYPDGNFLILEFKNEKEYISIPITERPVDSYKVLSKEVTLNFPENYFEHWYKPEMNLKD